jgi:hypothetical protein
MEIWANNGHWRKPGLEKSKTGFLLQNPQRSEIERLACSFAGYNAPGSAKLFV